MPIFRRVLAAALIATCGFTANAPAQTPYPIWQPNATVRALRVADGRIYLGGDFTQLGRATGGLVIADPSDAHAVAIPQVLGTVWTIVPDGAGGWFVGGAFSHVGGVARRNLARIGSDGSVLSWNPGADTTVYALAVSGGTLYAGGHFGNVAGVARARLAAIDIASATATSWNPGANNDVQALAVRGDNVYVGGIFMSLASSGSPFLGCVSASTGTLTSWSPQPSSSVLCMVLNGNTLYVGGNFTGFGGITARNRIAALDATTGAVKAWDPNANNAVRAMTLVNGRLWAAGVFSGIGGASRGRAAALDTTTGLATAWNPRITSGAANAIAVANGRVFLGGTFTALDGGKPRQCVAALDTTTGTAAASWTLVNDAVNVRALAVAGSGVLVGGDQTAIDLVTRNHVAALDEATGSPIAWNPNVNGPVNAIALRGGSVYLGGVFDSVGTATRADFAEVDTATGVATSWNLGGADVAALEVTGQWLYMAGASSLREFDLTTHLQTIWNPAPDGLVKTIGIDGSLLYAGGDFDNIGGQPRSKLAAIERASGFATAFNPNPQFGPPTINAISIGGGVIHVGGIFSTVGGPARNDVAALLPSGAATSWNPDADGIVGALAVGTGAVYAAGDFAHIGGAARNRLAALDLTSGAALPWTDIVGVPDIRSFALSGSRVLIGGNFTNLAGVPQRNLACVSAPGTVGVEGTALRAAEIRSVAPNPARGLVRIEYALSSAAPVRLQVVDVAGRVRARLFEGTREAGLHSFVWQADLPSGVYFAVLDAGARRSVMRLVELR